MPSDHRPICDKMECGTKAVIKVDYKKTDSVRACDFHAEELLEDEPHDTEVFLETPAVKRILEKWR